MSGSAKREVSTREGDEKALSSVSEPSPLIIEGRGRRRRRRKNQMSCDKGRRKGKRGEERERGRVKTGNKMSEKGVMTRKKGDT